MSTHPDPASAAAASGRVTIGDREVHRLGFGAMSVCDGYAWGWPKDRAGAIRLLRRVVELGVNFIDTADSYGPDVSETLIAEALHPYPAGVVIATKGGYTRPNSGSWVPDGRPGHLQRALDGSLRRLRTDCIEVYQLHVPDSRVPFEDSVGTLADLRRAGKIRHVGLSSVNVQQLEAARRIVPVVSVQNHYNIEDRSDDDVVDACARLGIPFIPWYPLGSGRALASSRVKKVAKSHGATPAQIALAWLLARSPVMLPIPGTGSIVHLEENVGAARVTLPADDLRALG